MGAILSVRIDSIVPLVLSSFLVEPSSWMWIVHVYGVSVHHVGPGIIQFLISNMAVQAILPEMPLGSRSVCIPYYPLSDKSNKSEWLTARREMQNLLVLVQSYWICAQILDDLAVPQKLFWTAKIGPIIAKIL